MIAGILAVVAALIGYFGSKKSGAKDATAAAVGVAAGAGTYWTATKTDWGKNVVSKIDNFWTKPKQSGGAPVVDRDGNQIALPPGTALDNDGQTIRDASGSVVGSIADVLKDWGPAGTASVIGGTVVASKFKFEPWMALVAIGAVVLLVAK